MADDDLNLDSLLDDLDLDDKPKQKKAKKGRSIASDEKFDFDFDVNEELLVIDEGDVKPENQYGTDETSSRDTNSEKKESSKGPNQTKKKQDDGGRKRRVADMDDFDLGIGNAELVESVGKKANKGRTNARGKKRRMVGDDINFHEEDMIKVKEIQSQLKEQKSTGMFKNLSEKRSSKKKRKFIIIRLFVFIALGAIAFMSLAVIKQSEFIISEKKIKITQPSVISNNANFIYVDAKIKMESEATKITKLRLDSQELAIYLADDMEFEKYRFYVVDSRMKKYYETTTYNKDKKGGSEAELTFEPLDLGVEKFMLRIEDIETGYLSETIFELEAPIKYAQTKFFYNTTANDTLDIDVQSTVFSSAFTKTTVVAKGSEVDARTVSEENIENGNMYIKHRGTVVPFEHGESVFAYFDEFDMGISIVKHVPLSSLSGRVTFGATNIYNQETFNETLNILSLNSGHKVVRNIENNEITLEGIYNYDGIIVIPMFGRKVDAIPANPTVTYSPGAGSRYDVNVTGSADNEYFDRVAVKVEGYLETRDDNGEIIKIPADCKISNEGTDVVFKHEALVGKDLTDVKIVIEKYMTIEDGSTKVINLDHTLNQAKTTDIEFQNMVKESFLTRLKYKSKEITKDYITGFEPDMITNFDVDRIYKPIDTSTLASYSVYVEGFAFEDNHYFAILKEDWVAKDLEGRLVELELTHKIVAQKEGRNYNIIYDEIMQ